MGAMVNTDNVIRAFSADHIVQLTGLSKGQLRYWDKTGFFAPHYGSEDQGLPYGRIYSFRNLVGLRALAILRKEYKVPLQRLRRLAERLSDYDQYLWSELKIYVLGKDPHISPPGAELALDADGQTAPVILLVDIMNDVAERAEKLRRRAPDQFGQVERHRFVVHNAWVLSGTRIPTSAIKDFHDAGYSIKQIQKEYPTLERQDIEGALKHEERLAKSA